MRLLSRRPKWLLKKSVLKRLPKKPLLSCECRYCPANQDTTKNPMHLRFSGRADLQVSVQAAYLVVWVGFSRLTFTL